MDDLFLLLLWIMALGLVFSVGAIICGIIAWFRKPRTWHDPIHWWD